MEQAAAASHRLGIQSRASSSAKEVGGTRRERVFFVRFAIEPFFPPFSESCDKACIMARKKRAGRRRRGQTRRPGRKTLKSRGYVAQLNAQRWGSLLKQSRLLVAPRAPPGGQSRAYLFWVVGQAGQERLASRSAHTEQDSNFQTFRISLLPFIHNTCPGACSACSRQPSCDALRTDV